MVGFLGSETAKLRLCYVNGSFYLPISNSPTITIGKSLSSSASIFQGQKFVCIHLYCLQTELFSLFFFTDDAVFLALSEVMLP